jgi:hypothetical protein
MSDATHSDVSLKWLSFFFVCFILVIVGIGLTALCTYNVNAPEPKPSGGHGGMILPQDGQYAPHVVPRIVA